MSTYKIERTPCRDGGESLRISGPGVGCLMLHVDDVELLAGDVVHALQSAYRAGQEAKAAEIRSALGIRRQS